MTVALMVSRAKRTLPSPIRNMQPPWWKEYASLLLLQLMTHGPPNVTPSTVVPSTQYSLSGSAQPAPLDRRDGNGPWRARRMWEDGRPASSVHKTVLEAPSGMPTSVCLARTLANYSGAGVKFRIALIGKSAPTYCVDESFGDHSDGGGTRFSGAVNRRWLTPFRTA